jgi:hypothetical protein
VDGGERKEREGFADLSGFDMRVLTEQSNNEKAHRTVFECKKIVA